MKYLIGVYTYIHAYFLSIQFLPLQLFTVIFMTPTREQLELAAKAAGITVLPDYVDGVGIMIIGPVGRPEYWEPTTSKSEIFDLMVAIGVESSFSTSDNYFFCYSGKYYGCANIKDHNNDKGLATMWAVFLCAVEIGRAM
jgi:hypothetical protein